MTGSVTINEVTVTLRAPQHLATAAPPPVTGTCPRNNAIRRQFIAVGAPYRVLAHRNCA